MYEGGSGLDKYYNVICFVFGRGGDNERACHKSCITTGQEGIRIDLELHSKNRQTAVTATRPHERRPRNSRYKTIEYYLYQKNAIVPKNVIGIMTYGTCSKPHIFRSLWSKIQNILGIVFDLYLKKKILLEL